MEEVPTPEALSRLVPPPESESKPEGSDVASLEEMLKLAEQRVLEAEEKYNKLVNKAPAPGHSSSSISKLESENAILKMQLVAQRQAEKNMRIQYSNDENFLQMLFGDGGRWTEVTSYEGMMVGFPKLYVATVCTFPQVPLYPKP